MRSLLYITTVTAFALSLAHCSHDSNTLTVSPPLPPAEEPSDETPGAYVADAGANTPEGAPRKDGSDENGSGKDSSGESTSGSTPGGNTR